MTVGKLRTDLTGKQFGRLTVTGIAVVNASAGWSCICECGKSKLALTNWLTSGRLRSCGCLRSDAVRVAQAACRTHGRTNTRAFRIWTGILARCTNPAVENFKDYGGRGITVCERWREFVNFHADMGEPPMGAQIDRIDNDGPYAPENCRWVTPRQNSLNRRSTNYLTAAGVTKPITDWAQDLGISASAIRQRIHKLHWPIERAVTERKVR